MAKIVKTRKRRMRFEGLSVTLFIVTGFMWMASCLFLRSYNNSLSLKTQQINSQIATLETENAAVTLEIQTLSTRDRVVGIANEGGLDMNQGNIITVSTVGE
ncbi:MAG: cell division protein FtsL [Erysipelotrichaceae bacterium]|nr:cell division protein FtsL [Erysipelotrichaceae bacterium]